MTAASPPAKAPGSGFNWAALLFLGPAGLLLGAFKDSPLVSEAGDADQVFVGGGLTYTF